MPQYSPVSDPLTANLLKAAQIYARHEKIKLDSVSRYAHGDARAFPNLAKGKGSITLRKYDSAMGWLYANWPEGKHFPTLPFDIQLSKARNGG